MYQIVLLNYLEGSSLLYSHPQIFPGVILQPRFGFQWSGVRELNNDELENSRVAVIFHPCCLFKAKLSKPGKNGELDTNWTRL